ncbi:transporter substrate-binding domain-containing protein [Marinobacter fonticola]|uniref:transporter substrate-binding domain-containing protein n=1 Tax=Marinobacter fonticola TaxID=2603215 RepID=UPI0011E6157A|nr:transporter substrate-binding domain-containing protein [Marinobacter fonticola]
MRYLICITLACFSLFSIPLSVPFSLASERPVYTVGIEEIDHLPYFSGKEGVPSGFVIELLRLFAESQDIEFRFVSLPIKRLTASVIKGDVDFRFPDNSEWDLVDKEGVTVAYSDKVAPFVDGYLVRNGVRTLQPGARVGIIRGFDVARDKLNVLDGLNLQYLETSDYEGLLSVMVLERVDAVFANIGIVEWRTRNWSENDKFSFRAGLPSHSSHYRLSSINHVQLIRQFDTFLAVNASAIEKLQRKWDIDSVIGSHMSASMR